MDLSKIWSYAEDLVINFLRLALPYWLIRDLNRIKLLTFFVGLTLIVLGLTTITGIANSPDAWDTSKEFATIAVIMVAFAMFSSFFIHGFVPNPANRSDLPIRPPQDLIGDLAALILSLCFFSLLVSQILSALGVYNLIDPENIPSLYQFIRDHDLGLIEPFVQAIIATLVVVGLMLFRDRFKNRNIDRAVWDSSLTLRAIGPYCSVLIIFCSFFTMVINEYF